MNLFNKSEELNHLIKTQKAVVDALAAVTAHNYKLIDDADFYQQRSWFWEQSYRDLALKQQESK